MADILYRGRVTEQLAAQHHALLSMSILQSARISIYNIHIVTQFIDELEFS